MNIKKFFKKRNIFILLFLIIVVFCFWQEWIHPTIYRQNNNNNYPKTKIEIPSQDGFLIAVYKDAHKLFLYQDNKIIKEYDVNIKRELVDRTIWEDNQTPEGIFKIETMDEVTNGWSRWMRLDTHEKAKEIYKGNVFGGTERIRDYEKEYGEIKTDSDIRKFNSIYSSHKILRGIGIHGGGFSLYNEWTQGCIALNNEDVDELFEILKKGENKGMGVPVIIQD